MIIGHGDNDHIGGARSVQQHFPIIDTLSSVPERLDWGGQKARHCRAGQQWHWDGVDFKILHPTDSRLWQGNNASCVLHISNKDHSILLTGDIEALAEARLKSKHQAELKSTVLVAPHHGSNTSLTQDFIESVGADYVLMPMGYLNR